MRAIPDEYRECNAVSNVQNAFSVWGEEFVNFIAATLPCRILRRAEKAEVGVCGTETPARASP